jgi:hypothetical protein
LLQKKLVDENLLHCMLIKSAGTNSCVIKSVS